MPECAHCGSPDGKYYKRKKLVLCYDCYHEDIPNCYMGCDEFQSYPEEQPCAWCVRNKTIAMKDSYRNSDLGG